MKTLSYWTIDVVDMRGGYLKDDYAPIIALNRKDPKTAQVFTLAHELAHLFINSEAVSNIDFRDGEYNAEERRCNQVAANFLLPTKIFEQESYESEKKKRSEPNKIPDACKKLNIPFERQTNKGLKNIKFEPI